MGLGSVISRGLSDASSSNYEPSHRSSSTSIKSTRPPSYSTMRASTITSATSMSTMMRSASTASISRQSTSASMTSTLRPPTVASRTSKASNVRASTATSTSTLIRSASSASTLYSQASTPAASTNNLRRSLSKRPPSSFSATASRLLWGRPPPGHSTLQPTQIAALTYTLSLPIDTPMLSSIVGALDVSRSQFSPVPLTFCNAHIWYEKKHIDELTEVIAHEIGPQLDKLRTAPPNLISKKTARLLSTLQPYRDIFLAGTTTADTSSILSTQPPCQACTLSHFFQNPAALHALTLCVKGRKHRAHPWPASMAWLDPCPGKGVDWDAKWRKDGQAVGHDRVRVQRWRRQNRASDALPITEDPPVAGHRPGEGCDFCDSLRLERADEAELDAAIEEEEEEEGEEGGRRDVYGGVASGYGGGVEEESETSTLYSDSETLRGIEEDDIIKEYLRSSAITTMATPMTPTMTMTAKAKAKAKAEAEVYHPGQTREEGGDGGMKDEEERKKRASDWARSYRSLVGKRPELQTTLMLEHYPEIREEVGAGGGGGWF